MSELQTQPEVNKDTTDKTQDSATESKTKETEAPKTEEIMIPKYRLDEVTKKHSEAEAKLAEALAKLETYSKHEETIERLTAEMEELKNSHKLEKQNVIKEAAIDKEITGKVVDIEVVKKLIDMDKIKVDDEGKVTGLDKQLKQLQKDKAYLWEVKKPIIKPSVKPVAKLADSYAKQLAEKKVAANAVAGKAKEYF